MSACGRKEAIETFSLLKTSQETWAALEERAEVEARRRVQNQIRATGWPVCEKTGMNRELDIRTTRYHYPDAHVDVITTWKECVR